MPTTWTTAEWEPDLFEQRPEPARSVGVALRQYGRLLDERLARAPWRIAPKPADLQIDDRLPTRDWEIAELALVTTVECVRPGSAIRAVCAHGVTANGNVHDVITQLHLLDNEPGALRQ